MANKTTAEILASMKSQTPASTTGGSTATSLPPVRDYSKNKIFSGGFFSDVADAASIPFYAGWGAIDAASKGKNVLKGIGEGYKYRQSASKTLGLSGVGGFAADVLLDPLNVVGIGGLTKAGKLAQKGLGAAKTLKTVKKANVGVDAMKAIKSGKTAIKSTPKYQLAKTLAKQSELGQRSLLTVFGKNVIKGEPVMKAFTKLSIKGADTALGKSLRTVFKKIPKDINKNPISFAGKSLDYVENVLKKSGAMEDLKRASGLMESVGRRKAVEFSKGLARGFAKLKKKGVIDVDDIKNFSIRVNDPKSIIQIPKELEPLLQRTNKYLDDINEAYAGGQKLANKRIINLPAKQSREFLKESAEGKLKMKGSLDNIISAKYYKLGNDIVQESDGVARSLTGSGKEYVKKNGKWVDDAGRQLSRSNATPTQLNQVLENAGAGLRFEEDITQQILATGVASARKQGVTKFLNETKGMGIKVAKNEPVPKGYARSQLKELEGYAFPKDHIKPIEGVYTAYSDPAHMNAFFKNMSKIQGPLKLMQTAMNIPFHVRNKVSNLWQMGLDDVTHIAYVPEAIATMAADGLGKVMPGFKNVMKYNKKYLDEFENLGLKGSGWEGVDIGADLASLGSKVKDNPLTKLPGAIGGFLEDSSKFGMYKSLRKKGWEPENAAMQVKKFLFDYGDLTDIERGVLKQIFPYYTWTRKNLPLQVSALINSPHKISSVEKAKRNYEKNQTGEKMDYNLMPEWLRDAYPIWAGEKDGVNSFYKLQGFVPTLDLDILATNPVQTALDMASPILKTPVELLSNYDFFYRDQIKDYEGQTTELMGKEMDPRMAKVLKTFRVPGEIDRMMGIKDDENFSWSNYLSSIKKYNVDPEKKEGQLHFKSEDLKEKIYNDMKYTYKKPLEKYAKEQGLSEEEFNKRYKEAKNLIDDVVSLKKKKRDQAYFNETSPDGSWDKKNYDKLIQEKQSEVDAMNIEYGVSMEKIDGLMKAVEMAEAGEGIRIT